MTISTTASRISYNGNGVTTVFSFPYRFLANGDVVVVELSALGVETVKTLTTDYTLTGAGDDAGGSVTMLVAPASGTKLTIYRNTGVTQEVDYISGDPFPAETHERALDRLTMIAQETNTTLSRTLKIPVTSDADTEITFNAGEFLAINQDGDAIITTPGAPDASVPVSTFMETLLDDTTAAAARTTLGAGVTGSTLFTAASAAAGRSTLSAAQSGANADITSLSTCTAISGLATLNAGKFIPRGHIDGLTLSTAGSSATFAVAAGDATDDGQAVVMTLAASISKTTGSWAVGTGNGALDTGAIANSTWYHAWLIRRSDTGVVDVLVSLSATAPTMPTGYDQKRLIGSMRTNGSAQWVRFVQYGDEFWWFTPVLDASSSANPGTTAVTETLENTPANRVTKAMVNAAARNSGTGVYVGLYLSSLTLSDDVSSETTSPLASVGWSDGSAAGNRSNANPVQVWTNSNSGGGQIRWRINGSDANVNVYIATLGWIDPRGRNA